MGPETKDIRMRNAIWTNETKKYFFGKYAFLPKIHLQKTHFRKIRFRKIQIQQIHFQINTLSENMLNLNLLHNTSVGVLFGCFHPRSVFCLFGCFHPRSVCVLVSLIGSVLLDATPSRVSIKTVPTTRCRQAYLDKYQEKLLHKQTT